MLGEKIRIKKGFANAAIYDFGRKRVYLIRNEDADCLLNGKLDPESKLYATLKRLEVIREEDGYGADPTAFDYELFDDAFSYQACKLIYFEVTNRCNFQCMHCYADIQRTGDAFIGVESARLFLKKIAEHSPCDIRITGGEPFLHKDILEILEAVSSLVTPRSRHSIATNGSFSLEQAMFALEMGYELQVSVYGMTGDVFSKFTNTDSAVLDSLFRKLDAIAKTRYFRQVTLAFAVNHLSYSQVEEMIAYSKARRFSYILNRTASAGRANQNLSQLLMEEQDRRTFAELQGRPIPSYCYHLCQLHWLSLRINGDITPCPYFRTEQFVMGNLKKSSFREIWESERYNRFRALTAGDVEHCRDCEFEYVCTAGCCGETLALTGQLLESYPWCEEKPFENPQYLVISPGEVYETKKLAAGIFQFSRIQNVGEVQDEHN